MKLLEFDLWEELHYDDLSALAAESGKDRELDFNWDEFVDNEYCKYLTTQLGG